MLRKTTHKELGRKIDSAAAKAANALVAKLRDLANNQTRTFNKVQSIAGGRRADHNVRGHQKQELISQEAIGDQILADALLETYEAAYESNTALDTILRIIARSVIAPERYM